MSIRWLRIKINWGYRPPKKDLTCNYHFRQQGIGKQAWKNIKRLCGQRKMTEAWKWIQDRKPEPEKEAECKSTQASRATSFMLTCASPNMPCGDYFPAASDVTLTLLSLLLTLPCFFSPPFIAKWIYLLMPAGFQTLSTVVWQASLPKLQRFLIDDRDLSHFQTIATKNSPWYGYEIAQLFLMHYIWETYFKCVTKQPLPITCTDQWHWCHYSKYHLFSA